MGIDATLVTEAGETLQEVFDPDDLFQQLLPHNDEPTVSACLRFIDPYGDTTFNQLQIPVLINELESAVRSTRSAESKKQGEKVLELAKKATSEPHYYVKFIGD